MNEFSMTMYNVLSDDEKMQVNNFVKKLVSKRNKEKFVTENFLAEIEKMRGSISTEDANISYEALSECRKIDHNEW